MNSIYKYCSFIKIVTSLDGGKQCQYKIDIIFAIYMSNRILKSCFQVHKKEFIQFPSGKLAASSSVLLQLKPSVLEIQATWMWATKTTP